MAQVTLVDDNEERRNHIAQLVTVGGVHHCTGKTQEAAVKTPLLSGHQPEADVILYTLDSTDTATLSLLRALYPQVPVIALLPGAQENSPLAAMRAGAHDFLSLPVSAERMEVSLQNALRWRTLQQELHHLRAAVESKSTSPRGASGTIVADILPLTDTSGHLKRFHQLEAEVIRFALRHYRGHMSEVARRLGIGRSTLYRKLQDYGINTDAA